ncbi:MAG TPA: hypothetical protein PKE29_15040 [Phycisphaerales bacterium]|nr:hypothetical protein [Phycisphaerales bacterium]
MPPDHAQALRLFLAGRDAPCPRCSYNLRDCEAPACPECGRPITLHIADPDPRTFWDTLGLIAVALTSIYFAVRAVRHMITLASGLLSGSGLGALRADASLIVAIDIALAALGLGWCVVIVRFHSRRPRPVGARPTTAAAGMLLAVFVAFLFAYGLR